MVNLMNEKIRHKIWGTGVVTEQKRTCIKIEFDMGVKAFEFPAAFEHFLVAENDEVQQELIIQYFEPVLRGGTRSSRQKK